MRLQLMCALHLFSHQFPAKKKICVYICDPLEFVQFKKKMFKWGN